MKNKFDLLIDSYVTGIVDIIDLIIWSTLMVIDNSSVALPKNRAAYN